MTDTRAETAREIRISEALSAFGWTTTWRGPASARSVDLEFYIYPALIRLTMADGRIIAGTVRGKPAAVARALVDVAEAAETAEVIDGQ
jgi:hypothetical protein